LFVVIGRNTSHRRNPRSGTTSPGIFPYELGFLEWKTTMWTIFRKWR
jgi:hypothetical protein